MPESPKRHRWVGFVSFVGSAFLFVLAYSAMEGRPPDLGVCAKASFVVVIFSALLSGVIRAALK